MQMLGKGEELLSASSPGVMQLESNLASVGRTSPFSKAFLILSSASLADLFHTNQVKKNCKHLLGIWILKHKYMKHEHEQLMQC